MTSRERVLAAINHQEGDRIPIDLGGFNASTILAEAYKKLLKHLGIETPIYIGDTSQFWVLVDEVIRERFGLDVEPRYPLYDALGCRRDREWKDWTHPSGTRVKVTSDFQPLPQGDGSYLYEVGDALYRLPSGGHYFDIVKNPYAWVQTPADVEKMEIPVMDDAEIAYISKRTARTRMETDRFVITEIFGGWNDLAGPWLGHEKFYIDIIANTSMMHALFEHMTEVWMRKIDQLVAAVGDKVDAVPVYNDLGSNMGGIYRTETIREMVIPYIRRFNDHVERVSGYHIIFHSCGSVYQYLPDLIEAGVKILNPVQLGARDMEPEKLKREFGKDLVFWGGAIDPQHTLSFGTPVQVREEARRNIEVFKKGGGFVFNNPHNVQSNVSPENVVALYDAATEFGSY
jgi:uroporphyrinogen decarboxylase